MEKLGYLDDLEKKYDGPIAFFTRRVDELKKEKTQQNAPLVFVFTHKDTVPTGVKLRKNFGYAVLSKIFTDLGYILSS